MMTMTVNISAWVDGCPVGPSGLLASMGGALDSVDMCDWVVCGIYVFGMFVSAVLRTWPPTSWVESWAGGSIANLFLGGIL
jgi:hypothetical protein